MDCTALATVPPAYFLQDLFAYVQVFERLGPCLFSDLFVGTAAVVGRSGLRSVARGDLVVPGHRTEWDSRSFAVAGPKCWNKLPVGLEICRLVLRLSLDT